MTPTDNATRFAPVRVIRGQVYRVDLGERISTGDESTRWRVELVLGLKRPPDERSQSDRRFFSVPSFFRLPCVRFVRKILTELVCADFAVHRRKHRLATYDLGFGDLEFGK
jgi:hypothetical protein